MKHFPTFAAVLLVALLSAGAAAADPITALITAINAFAATSAVAAFVVRMGMSLVFSALATALAGKPSQRQPGIKTEHSTTGGVNPQTFILGTYATAGNMAAPPYTEPNSGKYPNIYLTYVVDIADMPGVTFSRLMVSGEYIEDLQPSSDPQRDYEGEMEGVYPHLWLTWHDGSQTAADPYMMEHYATHAERPWSADMIGTGLTYAVVTFKYNRERWNQLPGVRFEVRGIPLYDPRADETVGGTGAQRWGDPATWAQTDNPAVMIYNILRGLTLPDGRRWGGQVAAADLPLDNWFAAMNECDLAVALEAGGTEPQYRAGLEVSVDTEPAAVIEELMKACSASISEVGGVYKLRVGPPALPVFFMSDDDVVVDRPQSLAPYPGLDGVHNAIHASHPSPAALWESRDAPPRYNAEWEAEDGGRQLVAQVDLPAVASDTQVQRLMRAWIEDERRFRRHSLTLPPEAAVLEPLDAVAWTSAREGYSAKVFEIGEATDDLATCLQALAMRERDAGDFAWDAAVHELPVVHPDPRPNVPERRRLEMLAVQPYAVVDGGGIGRRPGLLLTWDASLTASHEAVEYEVQLAGGAPVTAGMVPDATVGQVVIGEGLLASTAYRIRARLLSGRRGDWSGWVSAQTDDLRLGKTDLSDDVAVSLQRADGVRADHNALVEGFTRGNLANLEVDYVSAENAREGSEAARDAAQAARDEAQTFAGNADGSASAAAGSAETANTKAGEAGNSAAAARADRIAAQSATDSAQNAASASADSASLAASHAGDAGVSATAASNASVQASTTRDLVVRMSSDPYIALPGSVCPVGTTNTGEIIPSNPSWGTDNLQVVPGTDPEVGGQDILAKGYQCLYWKEAHAVKAGHTYRVSFRMACEANPDSLKTYLGIVPLGSDFLSARLNTGVNGNHYGALNGVVLADDATFREYSFDFTVEDLENLYPETKYVRLLALLNYSQSNTGNVSRLSMAKFEDITALVEVENLARGASNNAAGNMIADAQMLDPAAWRPHYSTTKSVDFFNHDVSGGKGYRHDQGGPAWWYQKKSHKIVSGRRYALRMEYRVSGGSASCYFTWNEKGTNNYGSSSFTPVKDGGWHVIEKEITADQITGAVGGADEVQFGFAVNHPNAPAGEYGEVRYLEVRDITESYLAGQFAEAASDSASLATAEKNAAGASATAASNSANRAATKAGEASTSATNAAQSYSGADGARLAAIAAKDVSVSIQQDLELLADQQFESAWQRGGEYWANGYALSEYALKTVQSVMEANNDVYLTTSTTEGRVLRIDTTSNRVMSERGLRPFVQGQKIRLRIRASPRSGGPALKIWMVATKANGDYLGYLEIPSGTKALQIGWHDYEWEFTPYDRRIASIATAARWRLMIGMGYGNPGGQEVASIQVDDVTESASVKTLQSAVVDLEGNASAGYLIKAQAGNQVSLIDLIAADGSTGSVSVAKISAQDILLDGSVTASKLLVSGNNLLQNGNLQSGDLSGWKPWSSPDKLFFYQTSNYRCIRFNRGAHNVSIFSGAAAYSNSGALQEAMPLKSGKRYRFEVTMWSNVAATTSFLMYFHKADGTYTSNLTIGSVNTTTTWGVYAFEFTVPSNVLGGHLYIYGPSSASGVQYFTNMSIKEMDGADLIVNGGIKGDKIQIDDVTLDTDGNGNLVIKNDGVSRGKIIDGAVSNGSSLMQWAGGATAPSDTYSTAISTGPTDPDEIWTLAWAGEIRQGSNSTGGQTNVRYQYRTKKSGVWGNWVESQDSAGSEGTAWRQYFHSLSIIGDFDDIQMRHKFWIHNNGAADTNGVRGVASAVKAVMR